MLTYTDRFYDNSNCPGTKITKTFDNKADAFYDNSNCPGTKIWCHC